MRLRFYLAIILGKCVSTISRVFRIGAGATWPGEIAIRVYPSILTQFAKQNVTTVLVAGTNGKTTTVKMIETILQTRGIRRVAHNRSGANLENGLVSAFVADMGLLGKLRSKYFIFEVDEATLPNILPKLTPKVLVLTNLFRDQLDRYGEVDVIAEKWLDAFGRLTPATTVLVNADDPHLAFIGTKIHAPVKYFGLGEPALFRKTMQHATDTIYCPSCGNRLTFGGVYFSHLGKWACGTCGFTHPALDIEDKDFESPLEGLYNHYNALAAALTSRTLGIADAIIRQGLVSFKPAFGRMETIRSEGKAIKILLSKNPTGFNESLRTVQESKEKGPLLLVLNDRIPDGTDISWIWDVDFEELKGNPYPVIVSGDRCFDLGLRLKYAEVKTERIYEQLEDAIGEGLAITKDNEIFWVLPTYSAMLEVRKLLTGRKIL